MFNDISTKSMKITELLLEKKYPFHYDEESDTLELFGYLDTRELYRGNKLPNGNYPSIVYAPEGLMLTFCHNEDLPKKLYCGGDLKAFSNGCKITHLPDVLYVNGELNLFRVPIEILPKSLNVTKGSAITSTAAELVIPEDFISSSFLDVRDSNIKKLPNRAIIMGDFWCSEALLENLSPDFIVLGKINPTAKYYHFNRKYDSNYWNC